MRRVIIPTFLFAAGLIFLAAVSKRDGTDPGYTGSPGDNYNNCTTCHGGMATPKEGWISSNIPSSGYVPGQTYTIRAANYAHGATRFGFEVSPQALNGDLLGTLVITDTSRTQLVGTNKYVTYREAGVDGLDSNIWTFDWVAPALGTGDVVFYGAFNSNPGHKGGDGTTLSTLSVKEHGTSGISAIGDRVNHFSLYPNPANDQVQLEMELKSGAEIRVNITDLKGKQVLRVFEGKQSSLHREIDLKTLPAGTYLVRMEVDGQTAVEKLNVVH